MRCFSVQKLSPAHKAGAFDYWVILLHYTRYQAFDQNEDRKHTKQQTDHYLSKSHSRHRKRAYRWSKQDDLRKQKLQYQQHCTKRRRKHQGNKRRTSTTATHEWPSCFLESSSLIRSLLDRRTNSFEAAWYLLRWRTLRSQTPKAGIFEKHGRKRAPRAPKDPQHSMLPRCHAGILDSSLH